MAPRTHSRVLAVLLAAVVLVGGANLAAYAANGKPLLLGKSSSASKKTTLKNTGSGPALVLKSKPGQPPLKVNRTTKVDKLNADRVDGLDADDLTTKAVTYEIPAATDLSRRIVFVLPDLPSGPQDVSFEVVANLADPGTYFGCYLTQDDAPPLHGVTLSDAVGTTNYLTGSTHVDTTTGTWAFVCETDSTNFELFPYTTTPSITFTGVDEATSTVLPVPAEPRRGASPRLAPR